MNEQLEHIELKIRQLLEEVKSLRLANAALIKENKRLEAEWEAQNERIGELTERLTNSQRALAQQRGDVSENSQKLRKQIDQYITEINKCIDWLQNA
jgi:regulator of replication initiation timing